MTQHEVSDLSAGGLSLSRCSQWLLSTGIVQFALFVVSAVGCGRKAVLPRAAVEGLVDIDGTKLASGVVRFIPTQGTEGPAAVATVTNGEFKLAQKAGPLVGTQRVEIDALNYQGFELDDEQAFVANVEQKRKEEKPKNPVPNAYNTRSTLTVTVNEKGPNKFDFHLRSDGAAIAAQ